MVTRLVRLLRVSMPVDLGGSHQINAAIGAGKGVPSLSARLMTVCQYRASSSTSMSSRGVAIQLRPPQHVQNASVPLHAGQGENCQNPRGMKTPEKQA